MAKLGAIRDKDNVLSNGSFYAIDRDAKEELKLIQAG